MKKNNLKKGLFTALLLVSSVVTAGNKYPAADFKPTVVYQNTDYKHAESAASFGEKAQDDSNFPAATYKPEVLFHDTEYKHNTKVANVPNSASASFTDDAVSTSSDESGEASSDETVSPILALIILAVAVFLFRKKSGSKAAVDNSGELTGVAKYLQKKAPKLSGVAKYLETHQPTPKSGVAKYVAKRVVEAKKAAAEKTTGVEKYMRKKG
ncbi:MAG: hypothetical protein PSN04_04725 [Methyloprofundus sp.]|nr:hypothetical protein [Methyloprofundus sp.]